jgi:hypothetical protein
MFPCSGGCDIAKFNLSFGITINPLNDERPEITKNAGLQLEYGEYAMISSVVLQSTDPDNSANEVYYILTSTPTKGSLQFCSDPYIPTRISECKDLLVGSNFTQLLLVW